MIYESRSPSDTFRLGRRLGALLRPGDVVALAGELGAGKTCLIRGLAAGAGVARSAAVSSPTFTLVNEYPGDYPGRVPFFHIDLYRLGSAEEAEGLGLEECLGGAGVAAVEWADRYPSLLPEDTLWIRLAYESPTRRTLDLAATGPRSRALLSALAPTA
jgi:tRNA threonylcarbamoyladenosine biosynthesis protein TsaE